MKVRKCLALICKFLSRDHSLICFYRILVLERRSTVLGGVLSPTDTSDLANDAYIYDVNGTLLNADAVYVATISALALNYRLLQGNFYVNPDKTATEVISEVTIQILASLSAE